MKIKDLIKELKKYDQSYEVGIFNVIEQDIDYNLGIRHHSCNECTDKFIFFYSEDEPSIIN